MRRAILRASCSNPLALTAPRAESTISCCSSPLICRRVSRPSRTLARQVRALVHLLQQLGLMLVEWVLRVAFDGQICHRRVALEHQGQVVGEAYAA